MNVTHGENQRRSVSRFSRLPKMETATGQEGSCQFQDGSVIEAQSERKKGAAITPVASGVKTAFSVRETAEPVSEGIRVDVIRERRIDGRNRMFTSHDRPFRSKGWLWS